MSASVTKSVLIVYGEGGHQAQMRRLLSRFTELRDDGVTVIAVVEAGADVMDDAAITEQLQPLRAKTKSTALIHSLMNFCRAVLRSHQLIRMHNVGFVLSTGPGIAIPVTVAAKLRGVKVSHIETWSRFYSSSWTARFLYLLASDFYVQNKELLSIFPKATWSGRL
jgi:UDP-N-acetylglucosamine:LPS N-acetylglucosamine transferase